MDQASRHFKKIKYAQKDTSDMLLMTLKRKKSLYFSVNHFSRHGSWRLAVKALSPIAVATVSYNLILTVDSYMALQVSYLIFGATCVVIGMSFGHDAAHNCLTGNKKADNIIFEIIFGLQGINAYLWKLRHNHSHHPFPNVHTLDSDLEVTNILYLGPIQRKKSIHYYQHIYAPLIYMFLSLIWIFYLDFKMFRKNSFANFEVIEHDGIEVVKLVLYKLLCLAIFLFFPFVLSPLPAYTILLSFVIMHLITSLVLTFIFFISHHVMEISYHTPHKNEIRTSWVEQQINSTMDFHAESKVANFIFGGFNAHLAHHLFPDVCHIHYPALSSLIKQTLAEHRIKYNSLGLFAAIRSHLLLLKSLPRKKEVHG